MDDAPHVLPGAFKGYVCAVNGDYREEVFADSLVYDRFDLFFGFCWGLPRGQTSSPPLPKQLLGKHQTPSNKASVTG